jgi:hypothetical protein
VDPGVSWCTREGLQTGRLWSKLRRRARLGICGRRRRGSLVIGIVSRTSGMLVTLRICKVISGEVEVEKTEDMGVFVSEFTLLVED